MRPSSIAFLRQVLLSLVPLRGLGLQVLRLRGEVRRRLLVVVGRLALLAVPTHTLLSILRRHLLLWVLHSPHGSWGPTLDADWIPLGAWGPIGAGGVRAALRGLRMGVPTHSVQLRPLHHHGIHWTAPAFHPQSPGKQDSLRVLFFFVLLMTGLLRQVQLTAPAAPRPRQQPYPGKRH